MATASAKPNGKGRGLFANTKAYGPWNIDIITLNQLSNEDQKIIASGRKSYKQRKTNDFLIINELI